MEPKPGHPNLRRHSTLTMLAALGLDRGRIAFIPQTNRTTVHLSANPDHLFKEVSVRVFESAGVIFAFTPAQASRTKEETRQQSPF